MELIGGMFPLSWPHTSTHTLQPLNVSCNDLLEYTTHWERLAMMCYINDLQLTYFTVMWYVSKTDVLSGYNGTIFAYGQTSSGKTHTMEVGAAEIRNFQLKSTLF